MPLKLSLIRDVREKKNEIKRDQLLKAEKQKEEKIDYLYQTLLYSITKEQQTIKNNAIEITPSQTQIKTKRETMMISLITKQEQYLCYY